MAARKHTQTVHRLIILSFNLVAMATGESCMSLRFEVHDRRLLRGKKSILFHVVLVSFVRHGFLSVVKLYLCTILWFIT